MGPVAAVTLAVALVLPPAAAAQNWRANVAAATRYAETRAGMESFAVTTEDGRLLGRLKGRTYPSASVLKAMLLVAYLNEPSVRARALTSRERSLLAPMIRRSANEPATYFVRLLRHRPLDRLAERAGMTRFHLVISPWGRSQITAADQARFFARIDRLTPARHRAYARRLLASVVPSQRWGIPPVAPEGWRIFLKGGWGLGTGWVTSQVALLERGERRVSLAVLTRRNPNRTYGTETVRGIAARLLRSLR
jgi:beta-lactamase family protein